jgi:hypothetical protein
MAKLKISVNFSIAQNNLFEFNNAIKKWLMSGGVLKIVLRCSF